MQILTIPTQCPICGGNTIIKISDSGTQELFCDNPDCNGKLINKLEHFISKKGLDIKHLSKATLEKLIDWDWVRKPRDLFYLYQRRREWVNKPGFGEKSVDRILQSIEDARHCELADFIAALGIPLIGKTYARQLTQVFEDYDVFRHNIENGFDFTTLNGFGVAMHDAIVNFDYAEADKMVELYIVDIKVKESELENFGNSLEGKVFVITGKLKNYKNRDLLKVEIESRGGKVVDSVSSKTTYLVNNDINSTSSKNKKAKDLGIPIITEEELLNMF